MYLNKNEKDQYYVKDVYCEKEFTDDDFRGTKTFGPGLKPSSGNIINTEHTWPQSRFTGRFPREMQKSDIHHLFPTDSEMNGRRGSLRFGRIVEEVEKMKCPQNKLGRNAEGDFVFEVPDSQKGNTARAIFYFATRYQMKVSPPEEETLRKWHKIDPVDEAEIKRNDEVEEFQGNRNPYIDIPDLINNINSFQ
jgi:endonuclease I